MKTVVQVTQRPFEARPHVAVLEGGFVRNVLGAVANMQQHSAPGGWVGVCPAMGGIAVQMHAADGAIETWRVFIEQEV